jgi:PAS domain S-box-containing protein
MKRGGTHRIWANGRQLALSVLALCLATFISYKLHFNTPTVVLIYVVVALFQSLVGGFISSAIVSLLAAACLDYFFLPPVPAFGMSDPLDVAAFFAFLIVTQIIARVISKRREALRQSEERLRLAFKATNDAIWDIDLKSGSVSWNETYSTLYGRPAETSDSWQWWIDRIHPEDRERTVAGLRGAISSAGSSWTCEYRFQRVDGEWAYIYDRAFITRDTSGNARRVIGAMQDLTERKQAEAAFERHKDELRESEERFRNVADTAPLMIWTTGPDMGCTFVNKSWLAFAGGTLEQVLGNGWTANVHPDDLERRLATYQAAVDERRPVQLEYRKRRADGEYRWVLGSGVPRLGPDGRFMGYVGTLVDITDLKRSRDEDIARQKLESVGRLAAGIAHDFNNLLGGVLAQADLALAELSADANPREELNNIRSVALRGAGIVRQLMIYAGQESATPEPVDISCLIDDMRELLKVVVSKHALLTTELGDELPAVLANPAQLRQVVMNLVTNASEAIGAHDGKILIRTAHGTAGVKSQPSGSSEIVTLEVSDTGRGMSKDVQAKIFDAFFTTKPTGHGLGLAVVQRIVQGLGGTIQIESELGSGSTFRVLLPTGGEMAQRPRPASARLEPDRLNDYITILVVEDEPSIRRAVVSLLRIRGLRVVEAEDGNEALARIREYKNALSLIVLDVTLPGAPGNEVLVEARRVRSDVKVIVSSAFGQNVAEAVLPGMQIDSFLRKPYTIEDLVSLITLLLTTEDNNIRK